MVELLRNKVIVFFSLSLVKTLKNKTSLEKGKKVNFSEVTEVISQKNNELLIKDLLIEFQQDEVELREGLVHLPY